MKTTVLNANVQTANTIKNDLLSRKTASGKNIFFEETIDTGFKIYGYAGKEKIKTDVFIFKNDNGRMSFTYDERLLSF